MILEKNECPFNNLGKKAFCNESIMHKLERRENIATHCERRKKLKNGESAAAFPSNLQPKDESQKSEKKGVAVFHTCVFWQHLRREKRDPSSTHKAKGVTDSTMLTLLSLNATPRHFTSSLYPAPTSPNHHHHHHLQQRQLPACSPAKGAGWRQQEE